MLKISIPKPCHQNWDEMLPEQQGRFCNSCAKTVVDFTLMNDEEVKNYFVKNAAEKTCGRFNSTQVHTIVIDLPGDIMYIPMPYWKRFLTASLITFSTTLFSCETNYNAATAQSTTQQTLKLADTTPVKNNLLQSSIVGKIKMPDSLPVEKICTQTMGIVGPPPAKIIETPVEKLMGDILFVPEKKDTVIKKIEPVIGTSVVVDPKYIKGKVVPPKTDTTTLMNDRNKLTGGVVLVDPRIVTKSKQDWCDKNIYQ